MLEHFEALFLGMQPKLLFFRISVRNFGIAGATTKPRDNPGVFKILGMYGYTFIPPKGQINVRVRVPLHGLSRVVQSMDRLCLEPSPYHRQVLVCRISTYTSIGWGHLFWKWGGKGGGVEKSGVVSSIFTSHFNGLPCSNSLDLGRFQEYRK